MISMFLCKTVVLVLKAFNHQLCFFHTKKIFLNCFLGKSIFTQKAKIKLQKSDPFIFQIEDDFSKQSHC